MFLLIMENNTIQLFPLANKINKKLTIYWDKGSLLPDFMCTNDQQVWVTYNLFLYLIRK